MPIPDPSACTYVVGVNTHGIVAGIRFDDGDLESFLVRVRFGSDIMWDVKDWTNDQRIEAGRLALSDRDMTVVSCVSEFRSRVTLLVTAREFNGVEAMAESVRS